MKAVYLERPEDIYIKEIDEPLCPAGYARVRVRAVGICGSDISAYKGTSPMCTYPRIIGHEVVGDIVEVNSSSSQLKVGDRVILEPYIYCGKCYPCLNGRTNSCENLKVLGVHIDGGMTEYISHPVHLIHKLPEKLSDEEWVMVEPLSIAMHALHRLKVKEGEHIAIFGGGQIGNLAAQSALIIGAIPILIDLLDERLGKAREVGIENVLNPQKDNIMEKIKEITGGRMAECVVEATGALSAIRTTLDVVACTGRIAFVGWPSQEISLPTALITRKELDIYGSRNSVGEFPGAIDLISTGRVDVKPVISKVVSLEEIPEYVRILAEEPGRFLKVIGKL
ncbi:MAG TPA: zinc-binding alcohol dehydrogenase family protein [bacterium]|nr:zinc-binding alcohol dehydrogenase family protein [Dictyoglomota bacterium]HOP55646.1 zinc-binding alcohol dehydrogenase family protein [bacterium]HRU33053.1 zinc-binding alcohol dehydrogenase family protein [bacterium]